MYRAISNLQSKQKKLENETAVIKVRTEELQSVLFGAN
jgi:hypothetical protein